jgi:hypothetical protein
MRSCTILVIALLFTGCVSTQKISETTYGQSLKVSDELYGGPIHVVWASTEDAGWAYPILELHAVTVCQNRVYTPLATTEARLDSGKHVTRIVFTCGGTQDLTSLTHTRERSMFELASINCKWVDNPALQQACDEYHKTAKNFGLPTDAGPVEVLPVDRLKRNLRETREADNKLVIYNTLFGLYLGSPEKGRSDSDLPVLAKDALKLAAENPDYFESGNVSHFVHLALGRVALTKGDVAAAIDELKLAGQTQGSPQLDSFGPNMLLAKDLIERHQTPAVIDYLQECKRFWKNDAVHPRLDDWISTVELGATPDFGANLEYGVERAPSSN